MTALDEIERISFEALRRIKKARELIEKMEYREAEKILDATRQHYTMNMLPTMMKEFSKNTAIYHEIKEYIQLLDNTYGATSLLLEEARSAR